MTSTWEDFEAEMADINVDAIVAEESGHLSGGDPFGMIGAAEVLRALEAYNPSEQEKLILSSNTAQLSDDGFDHLMGEAYLAAKARKDAIVSKGVDDWTSLSNRETAAKEATILNALGLFISIETIKRRTDFESLSEDELIRTIMVILQATLALAANEAMFVWQFKTAEDGSLDALHHLIDVRSGELLHWLCI